MRIEVNGETKEVPSGLVLDSLLDHLSLPRQRIAVELNREVVRKADWPATLIKDDDRIELVHFVGGG